MCHVTLCYTLLHTVLHWLSVTLLHDREGRDLLPLAGFGQTFAENFPDSWPTTGRGVRKVGLAAGHLSSYSRTDILHLKCFLCCSAYKYILLKG